ncbi:Transcriptional regulator, MerR family [Chitinispirillum alkaliphilum]|nr:Transcriptional regulator, MerR family [Chitinispirillum alkaliphilum]
MSHENDCTQQELLPLRKIYYSISEVCKITGLEAHVLRYWESEFPQLRPKKNRAGNRAYREKDIELIKYIKDLLYKEKFTIPGAKKKLSDTHHTEIPSKPTGKISEQQNNNQVIQKAEIIKEELKKVLSDLRSINLKF